MTLKKTPTTESSIIPVNADSNLLNKPSSPAICPAKPLWRHRIVAESSATGAFVAGILAMPVVGVGCGILGAVLMIAILIFGAFHGAYVSIDGQGLAILCAAGSVLGAICGIVFTSFQIIPFSSYAYIETMKIFEPTYQPSAFSQRLKLLCIFNTISSN